jgi:hypothetical protein
MRRPVRTVLIGICTVAIVGAVLPGVASAHDPIILAESQTSPASGPLLPDGTISFALYGVIDAPGETRGFRVRLNDGERLSVSMLIPDLAPENALARDALPTLRIESPDGAARDLSPDIRVPFDEPFTQTRYLRLVELDEPAVAGEYAITVAGSQPARFTVSVGTTEMFGTPVEGAIDRAAGITGVQAWYATAPPEVTPPSTTADTAAATEPPGSDEPARETSDDRPSNGSSIAVVVVALMVVGVLVAITLAARRRR